jgi:hypothetical protein
MKQLKTEIIALCDYALVDQLGKVSIMGIFDELRVEKFPGGFIDKFLVATIYGEPSKPYTLIVKLEKEGNGKNLLNPTIVNITTSPNGKSNVIVRLANVGFEKEGDYRFLIYNGIEKVGETLLKVIRLDKIQQPTIKMPN